MATPPDDFNPRDLPQFPRTDEGGEIDLEQIEYNLSLTVEQRMEQHSECRQFFEAATVGKEPPAAGWPVTLLKRLAGAGVPFVIIGDVAQALHGSMPATAHLEVCAAVDSDVARRIVHAFADTRPRWRPHPDLPPVREDSPWLAEVKNLYLRTTLGQLDVLGDIPGVCTYAEAAARSKSVTLGGISCRVIDLDTLIEAKRFAGRKKDVPAVEELELIRTILRRRRDEGGAGA